MQLVLDEKKIRKGKPIGLPYIGSKKKISKKIVEIIKQNFGTDKPIYDLFAGGGAITLECILNGLEIIYNDKNPIPGMMIQKVLSEDREFLKTLIVSREEFLAIRSKENKDVVDHLKLLINSFGNNNINYLYSKKDSDIKFHLGKQIIKNHDCFSGYKNTKTYKNIKENVKNLQQLIHIAQLERVKDYSEKAILRYETLERLGQIETTKCIDKIDININNKDYKDYSHLTDAIIYLDPPYDNSRKVYGEYQHLDHKEFYNWCIEMSKNNIVLISEYDMPDEFECVFEFKSARSTLKDGTSNKRYEKLFMVKKLTKPKV